MKSPTPLLALLLAFLLVLSNSLQVSAATTTSSAQPCSTSDSSCDGHNEDEDEDDQRDDEEWEEDEDEDGEEEWDEDEFEVIHAFYQKHAPGIVKEWARLEEEKPEEADRLGRELVERYYAFQEEFEHRPEHAMGRLRYDQGEYQARKMGEAIQQLVRRNQRTPSKQVESEIKKQQSALRSLLSNLFDLRLKLEKAELADMEAEMGRLKTDIERRESNREKIIQKFLSQLSGEADDLDW